MTGTATPPKRTDNRRRLELRLNPGEYRLLEAFPSHARGLGYAEHHLSVEHLARLLANRG
jgi:hypothetical protein